MLGLLTKVVSCHDRFQDESAHVSEGKRLLVGYKKDKKMNRHNVVKTVAACLAGILSLGMLGACGNQGKDANGSTIIKFGIHVANPKKQEAVTYDIVQAFNKKYQGKYKVVFEASDKESHSKNMKLEASDGTLPQLFWIDASEAPEYSKSGALLDLRDFLQNNPSVAKAIAGGKDSFEDKQTGQYGLPYQSNVQGFFYNKGIFDKLGIPYPNDDTTYEQLMETLPKIKAGGYTPIAIGSKNSSYTMWEFNKLLVRYGWQDNLKKIKAGKEQFNNPDFLKAFDKIERLAKAGAFPENVSTIEYFDAKQQFNDGKAALFGSGQWDCAEFDSSLGDKAGFWWGPKFSDSSYDQNVSMRVPANPIVVNKAVGDDAAMKTGVYEFLKFYYGEQAAKMSYAKSTFPATNYPGLKATSNQYAMNEMLKALGKNWPSPASAPDLTLDAASQQALYDAIFGVIQGTYTPSAGLSKIDQAWKTSHK